MITADEPNVKPGSRYSVKAAAELLGLHRNTIHKYIASGFLRAEYGVNGWPRVTGAEILRFWKYQI